MFNNAFPVPPKTKPHQKKSTTPNKPKTTSTQKWAIFTYIGKETTYIRNLLKNTELKVAMRTNNSIQNILMNNKQLTNNTDKCIQSGVHMLSCPDCNKVYVGQTGRNFLTRFNEHKAAFQTNNQNSNYAKHLTEHTHCFGPIQDTMRILQCQNKGAHLNTIERYYSSQKTIT